MIVKHNIEGTESTTLHDFSFEVVDNKLILNATHYTRDNKVLFENELPIEITIPTDDFEVWLSENGIEVFTKAIGEEYAYTDNLIDRLAWSNGTDIEVVTFNG